MNLMRARVDAGAADVWSLTTPQEIWAEINEMLGQATCARAAGAVCLIVQR